MEKFRLLAVSSFIMDKIVISMTPLITRNDENGFTPSAPVAFPDSRWTITVASTITI